LKKAWIILALLVVVGSVAAALAAKFVLGKRGETVHVSFAAVERRDLTATVSAPGWVQATSSVDISAEVPGRIVEMAVAEGDRVEAGQLLLRLDDARYRSQVEQTRAARNAAEANLTLAEARLDKAARDLVRLERLHEDGLASEEALEGARTDHQVAEAETEARRQELARAAASLEVSRDDLAKTLYRAPLAGIVSRLNVEAGENVVVGTMNNPGTVILSIADMSGMEVEAEVDETDVVSVSVGQSANITVDAIQNEEFPGTVVSVGNSGRGASRGTVDEVVNFEVVVAFDEPDPRLRPGMTADIEVETEHRPDVLSLPIQSLVARSRGAVEDDRRKARGEEPAKEEREKEPPSAEEEERRKEIVEGVYKEVEEKAVFVDVGTGIADGSWIEVSGELVEGDRVVSGPFKVLRELREGTRVEERESGGRFGGERDAD
jgi:HlyD family secretion protein